MGVTVTLSLGFSTSWWVRCLFLHDAWDLDLLAGDECVCCMHLQLHIGKRGLWRLAGNEERKCLNADSLGVHLFVASLPDLPNLQTLTCPSMLTHHAHSALHPPQACPYAHPSSTPTCTLSHTCRLTLMCCVHTHQLRPHARSATPTVSPSCTLYTHTQARSFL